jgi:hypothetical protein
MRDFPRPALSVAPADAVSAPALPSTHAASIKLLGGDEIIQFSIKPSLWMIPMVSARVAAVTLLLALAVAISSQSTWAPPQSLAVTALLLTAVARVLIASLQWASRLFVLTNRRVLRFSGIVDVKVAECALARIARTDLLLTIPQRLARVGSIRMTPSDDRLTVVTWEHVGRPAHVYQLLIRAIRNAQSGE